MKFCQRKSKIISRQIWVTPPPIYFIALMMTEITISLVKKEKIKMNKRVCSCFYVVCITLPLK